jgi:hypothetical protein
MGLGMNTGTGGLQALKHTQNIIGLPDKNDAANAHGTGDRRRRKGWVGELQQPDHSDHGIVAFHDHEMGAITRLARRKTDPAENDLIVIPDGHAQNVPVERHGFLNIPHNEGGTFDNIAQSDAC